MLQVSNTCKVHIIRNMQHCHGQNSSDTKPYTIIHSMTTLIIVYFIILSMKISCRYINYYTMSKNENMTFLHFRLTGSFIHEKEGKTKAINKKLKAQSRTFHL